MRPSGWKSVLLGNVGCFTVWTFGPVVVGWATRKLIHDD